MGLMTHRPVEHKTKGTRMHKTHSTNDTKRPVEHVTNDTKRPVTHRTRPAIRPMTYRKCHRHEGVTRLWTYLVSVLSNASSDLSVSFGVFALLVA